MQIIKFNFRKTIKVNMNMVIDNGEVSTPTIPGCHIISYNPLCNGPEESCDSLLKRFHGNGATWRAMLRQI